MVFRTLQKLWHSTHLHCYAATYMQIQFFFKEMYPELFIWQTINNTKTAVKCKVWIEDPILTSSNTGCCSVLFVSWVLKAKCKELERKALQVIEMLPSLWETIVILYLFKSLTYIYERLHKWSFPPMFPLSTVLPVGLYSYIPMFQWFHVEIRWIRSLEMIKQLQRHWLLLYRRLRQLSPYRGSGGGSHTWSAGGRGTGSLCWELRSGAVLGDTRTAELTLPVLPAAHGTSTSTSTLPAEAAHGTVSSTQPAAREPGSLLSPPAPWLYQQQHMAP